MTDPCHHDEQAPVPTTVAAWVVLGIVPIERVPWWAAQWLADSDDGEVLRELAGLNDRDSHAINDLLPDALAEMGIALPSTERAAVREAFRSLAEMCLAGRAGERWVAQQVEDIVRRADFMAEILDLPLGQLCGAEDAWQGGWGPAVEELEATVRGQCEEQLRATPIREGYASSPGESACSTDGSGRMITR